MYNAQHTFSSTCIARWKYLPENPFYQKNHLHLFPFKSHNFTLIASYTDEYGKWSSQKVFHFIVAAAAATAEVLFLVAELFFAPSKKSDFISVDSHPSC